jgi:hypothetical protein
MVATRRTVKSMGNGGWQSKKFLKSSKVAIRRTGKGYGGWQ